MRAFSVGLALLLCAACASACGSDSSSGSPPPGQVTTGGGNGNGSGSSGGSDPGTGGDGSAEQACVDSINMYRQMLGAPAYTRWNAEESCADGEAKSDGSSGAAHGAFGMCMEFAQNECPGWPGPAGTMITKCLGAMWMEGPGGGHHDTMASKQFTQVACGFYTKADGSVWAVQNFR
jgi:hypothetical protein